MVPPIAEIVKNSLTVQAVLGSDPIRVFPFGMAPQDVTDPYAVWQTVSGTSENYLGNSPDIDSFVCQVDTYADSAKDVRAAARVLRDAFEPHGYIIAWRGESRDAETKRYRFSFDVEFWVNR